MVGAAVERGVVGTPSRRARGDGRSIAMRSGTVGTTAGGAPALRLDVAHLGAAAILRLAGHLDATAATRSLDALVDLLDADVQVVVVDLLDLESMDGTGATVLLEAAALARRRAAALRVMASAPDVLDLLRSAAPGLDLCDLAGGRAHGRGGGPVRAGSSSPTPASRTSW
jgi:anti-anti-sigma factor